MSINRVETDLAFSTVDPVTGRLSAAANASVAIHVRNDDGTNGASATVYATPNTGSTLSNPLTTDTAGRIYGWVAQGSYNFSVSGTGITASTLSWEAVPASQISGSVVYGTTVGTACQGNDARLTKVGREEHTWTIGGAIAVATGSTDLSNYIPPIFVSIGASETVKVIKARYVIGTGTSATCKIQKNGVDLTGFTGMAATTTAGSTTPTGQAVAEDDALALIVTGVSGSPGNLAFTLILERTAV